MQRPLQVNAQFSLQMFDVEVGNTKLLGSSQSHFKEVTLHENNVNFPLFSSEKGLVKLLEKQIVQAEDLIT